MPPQPNSWVDLGHLTAALVGLHRYSNSHGELWKGLGVMFDGLGVMFDGLGTMLRNFRGVQFANEIAVTHQHIRLHALRRLEAAERARLCQLLYTRFHKPFNRSP